MAVNAAQRELLVNGYLRNMEKQHNMCIPLELISIVLTLYPRKYSIFGIGRTMYQQFGLKEEYDGKNEEYDEGITEQKWQHLPRMSALCFDPELISCSNSNFFVVDANRDLYAVGYNLHGSAGIGDESEDRVECFTKLHFAEKDDGDTFHICLLSQAAYANHTFVALTGSVSDRQVFYAFGSNDRKQLAYLSEDDQCSPVKISALNAALPQHAKIIAITAGFSHSLFLTASGRVFCCGSNDRGQCGINLKDQNNHNDDEDDEDIVKSPQMIPDFGDIVKIASGEYHNLCIDQQNEVWVFGDNQLQQLGLAQLPQYKDESVVTKPVKNDFFKERKIVFIDCGDDFSLCIAENGHAFLFGANGYGQLGNGEEDHDYVGVGVPFCVQSRMEYEEIRFESGSCGCDHAALISYFPHNNLYAFGNNNYHQTGDNGSSDMQLALYMNTRAHIGAHERDRIVRVICDDSLTVIVCET